MSGEIFSIVVRVPNWIGDGVMALPGVEALKALYPKAALTVLAKERTAPLFENNPAVDEIIVYERGGRHKGFNGRFLLARELAAKKFDLAVLFQNAFEAAFIAKLAGVPERVGYARDLRGMLLTKPLKVTKDIESVHQVFYYLNIVKELGGAIPGDPIPAIRISKEEEEWARNFLRSKGLKEGQDIIGAAPGASYGPAKRWAAENFATTLNSLANDTGALAVICGGKEDAEVAKTITSQLKCDYLDLAGEVSLREFMAIAARLRLFITNDSGPMHIGAALGVATVAVFGSTDPVLTGPLGRQVKVLYSKPDCGPCFERECPNKDYKCFDEITPEVVLSEARGFLEKSDMVSNGSADG